MCDRHYNALGEKVCDWYDRGRGLCLKRGQHKGEPCLSKGLKGEPDALPGHGQIRPERPGPA